MNSDRPTRGTRPANRRELILSAATELFATRGYENVNMADVAAEVSVGASALYRHFRGKGPLLEAVLEQAGDTLLTATRSHADGLERAVRDLAASAIDYRSLGVLHQREARHLPTPARRRVDTVFDTVRDELGRRVAVAVPGATELEGRYLSSAVLGVLLSPWVHRFDVARPQFEELLTQLALRVVSAHATGRARLATPSPPVTGSPLGRTSRREVILRAALDLFAESTFASVGMNDVAAAAGMASASVYHHFESKVDLLSIALERGNGYLQLNLDRILYRETDEASALRQLVASYCSFAFAHPTIIDLLITETRNLPAASRSAITQSQRDYVNEWAQLYRHLNPHLDEAEAAIVIQGVLMLVNDLARLPMARSRPEVECYVADLATAGLLRTSELHHKVGAVIGQPTCGA
jgi:AcrR family transcriptional regulator